MVRKTGSIERRWKRMDEYEVFQHIPFSTDSSEYNWLKEDFFKQTDRIISNEKGRTPIIGVNGALATFYDDMIEENGMDRVVIMVIAFIYVMEHDDVNSDLAYAVNWHIEDFENGDYESLFEKEDLRLLKEDIARIKEYLKKHPEMIKE